MPDEIEVRMTVNTVSRVVRTHPFKSLLRVLREDLSLTAAKEGCGQGDCGSCIVLVDGVAVNSCLMLAPQADGAKITTLEGSQQATISTRCSGIFATNGHFSAVTARPGC